ncbi:hypothetical protein ACHAWC_004721 [Mediolabrus comicus]
MSLRNLSPPLVTLAGVATVAGLPALDAILSTTSLPILKCINAAAFVLNVGAVSVPGRLDGQQDEEMRKGELNPTKPDASNSTASTVYGRNRSRTLVDPSGWAFAIWGPIYIGETSFVAYQLLSSNADAVIPGIAAPFAAANILQSLWCASFRPSYLGDGMKKYISAATILGIGVTISMNAPVYGFTIAWALSACADGMTKRQPAHSEKDEKILSTAAKVQSKLCWAGSLACGATALYTALV